MPVWSDLFSTFRHNAEKEYRDETGRKYLIRRKVDILGSGCIERYESAIGEKRLVQFEQILENGYSMKRHHFERLFHGICVQSLCMTLMGSDWETHGVEVQRARGWLTLSPFSCAMAPRRCGKSMSTAKVIAALAEIMILMPEGLPFSTYPIAIFSTGKRASQGLSAYVEAFLKERGMFDYVVKNNSEEIVLKRKEGQPMTVSMKFLPSNPDRYFLSPFLSSCYLYRAQHKCRA